MRIDEVNVFEVTLPFTGDYSHSRRKGPSADSVVVEVVTDQKYVRGYGEGAPRPYVTGETQPAAVEGVAALTQQSCFPWQVDDISQIWEFIDAQPGGKGNNAAICAVELGLLDALGKGQQQSVLDYFDRGFYSDTVHYGATIPLGSAEQVAQVCQLIKAMRINQLRVKMGKLFEQNRDTLRIVEEAFGSDCDVRVDSNGAWDYQLALEHVALIGDHGIKVVEQPLAPRDGNLGALWRAMQPLGVVLMADESVCSLEDLEQAIRDGFYGMVNVRLSKCGGLGRSLKIVERLRSEGLSFQVGCQLGESGILSAAGRALALLCCDAAYYDGSYDRFLLKENITTEDVSLGPGGEARPLDGPGLGVKVDRERLNRLSRGSASLAIRNP